MRDNPFLIAILAGFLAQMIKVLSFILLEKRVNYKRFVQSEGNPNMHSAAMSALTLAVGLKDGFTSVIFAVSLCLSILIMIDIMNVKNAASQQVEVIRLVVQKLRIGRRSSDNLAGLGEGSLSYSFIDVLCGAVLGVVVALIVY